MGEMLGVWVGAAVGVTGVAVGNGVMVGRVATGLVVGRGLLNGTGRKAEASAVATSVGRLALAGEATVPQPVTIRVNSTMPVAAPKILDISIEARYR